MSTLRVGKVRCSNSVSSIAVVRNARAPLTVSLEEPLGSFTNDLNKSICCGLFVDIFQVEIKKFLEEHWETGENNRDDKEL